LPLGQQLLGGLGLALQPGQARLIDIGLNATPIANGRDWPIAAPIHPPLCLHLHRGSVWPVVGSGASPNSTE
jgi:hypothetical protein